MRYRGPAILLLLLASLAVSMLIAIATGPTSVHLASIFQDATAHQIIFDIRLPRVIAAVLVGAALATAGTAMQALFKNPMADPYIIGTSAGGSLGAVISIVFLAGVGLPVLAFTGAVGATFLVYTIARRGGKIPVETLLLTGVALSMFLSAMLSFLMYTAGKSLHQIVFWLMGGFWTVSWDQVWVALLIPAGCLLIYLFARDINIISLGDEDAVHLGVNVEQLKILLLFASAVLAGIAVSIAGAIGFIGLITPHLMRTIVGPDHRVLFPAAILAGALILLWADTFTRTFGNEMPVGIITAFLGAPFFMYLLRRRSAV
ncbi:MAG: iron ABC transporter permease [Methanocalculus sp. MSAO_Arc1]|uniref:FecCD family ABC transporter permease n=1 Tax=Methanocalculus TaxID=71151 RepID=UPI000FEFCFE7|nr:MULTISPECIES: iron chelate uptake ABC transporter family permease subunit [unclassified Methanocalculus]MCP1661519.1 iron complex transport system permease protein [Methanocalculus sp. AMF5]RQD81004.1 MAG: iron ABC transporter permease [Methanocalculus sp. MSAO_Arc1]